MLLEEDVVMNTEDFRLPSLPSGETPPLPSPWLADEEYQTPDEISPLPISPPPIPWPRVFPSL